MDESYTLYLFFVCSLYVSIVKRELAILWKQKDETYFSEAYTVEREREYME